MQLTTPRQDQRPDPQARLVGPLLVPLWQLSLSEHQPQLPRSVQVRQLPDELHESCGFAQDERTPAQLAHMRPVAGPVAVPDMQVFVLRHHPQPGAEVQLPQSVRVAQVSAVMLQAPESPAHIALQVPVAGPLRDAFAVTHRPAPPHHPQPERARQVPQPVSDSQGSEPLTQEIDE